MSRSPGVRHVNPFHAGSPVTGDHFGDRDAERALLLSRMRTGQNVLVVSHRRYGKTSLLLETATEARRRGVRVAYANLRYAGERREVAEVITRAVIEHGLGWRRGTRAQVAERVRRLPGLVPVVDHDGWSYSLVATAPRQTFLDEIRRPVALLAEAATARRPVALILDEFQQTEEIDSTLPGVFKAIVDDLASVSVVFAGSQRHVIDRLFAGSGAALQFVAERLALGVIPEPDMVAFLQARATTTARTMTAAGAAAIYEAMRGVPYWVQQLAGAAWDRGEDPIDVDVARLALSDLLARQGADLSERYERMRTTERRLVRALAEQPEHHLLSTEFARRARLPVASLQRARDRLEAVDQIVYDDRSGWRVYDPVFERWLQGTARYTLGEA